MNAPESPRSHPRELLEELISLQRDGLDERLRGVPPDERARIVAGLRDIAAQYYNSDAAEARKIAGRALEIAEGTEDATALGWGHRAVAESLLFSGRMREAEAAYERAARAWRAADAPGLLGQLLVGRIHVLSLLGRHAEAEDAASEARRCLETTGDDAYLAKLAMNLGNMRFQLDRYGPALESYDRAAAAFRALRVRDETVIRLEMNRGVALTQLDRDDEALALFRRLERECQRRGNGLILAQIRMNAAVVHSLRAEFDEALRDLAMATDYFVGTDHPAFIASCLLNRAEIYHQLNLHRDAVDLTSRAAPLFHAEGLIYDEALTIAQEAVSLMAENEMAPAIRKLKRARSLFDREGNAARIALIDMLRAEALSRTRGRQGEAREIAAHVTGIFRALGLRRWEAAATVLLTTVEGPDAPGEPQIRRLRTVLRRIPPTLYPIASSRILERIAAIQERRGRTRDAARTYRRAIERLEDVRARIPSEDSKIAFLQDKTYLYDRSIAIEVASTRPSVERIFEWMERSRAQSLWDRLRTPASYLGPTIGASSAATRRRIAWLHVRISRLELGTPEQRIQAAALRSELIRAEESWSRALRADAEVRKKGHPHGPPPSTSANPTIADVRNALPDGWGFLGFHLSRDLALALVITRDGSDWRVLRPDLAARMRTLADRLDFQWNAMAMASAARRADAAERAVRRTPDDGEDPRENSLRESADAVLAEIGRVLWKPIEDMAGSTLRWIVSPHGPIHRIPLHALRTGEGYLVERTDILLVPSARIWLGLPKPGRKGRALVAGVPSADLPAVEGEIDRVCQHLAGWTVERDLAPTRGSLRSRGSRVRLLHLAAHGMVRSDNPAYSFIEVADGPLFVHDLANFRLPGSTVVLSSCSSGRGISPAGDEWIGLPRAFLQAGASTVVASLWPIEDDSTVELMDLCYSGIVSGRGAALALGDAMRALMRRKSHPWRWAAFASFGRS